MLFGQFIRQQLRYHKLPELFRHRAKMDEERRIAEASEAVRLRQQQRTLSEQKLRESHWGEAGGFSAVGWSVFPHLSGEGC